MCYRVYDFLNSYVYKCMTDFIYSHLGEPVAQPHIWVAWKVSLPLYNTESFQTTYFQEYMYFRNLFRAQQGRRAKQAKTTVSEKKKPYVEH